MESMAIVINFAIIVKSLNKIKVTRILCFAYTKYAHSTNTVMQEILTTCRNNIDEAMEIATS